MSAPGPVFVRVGGHILVWAPILLYVLDAVVNRTPLKIELILAQLTAALGGSQVGRRLGDVPAAEVKAKVEERVAEVIASMPPAAPGPKGVFFQE